MREVYDLGEAHAEARDWVTVMHKAWVQGGLRGWLGLSHWPRCRCRSIDWWWLRQWLRKRGYMPGLREAQTSRF